MTTSIRHGLSIVATLFVIISTATDALAQGNLMPTNPPGPTMYSLQQIYERTDEVSDGFAILTNALGEVDWNDVIYLGVACQAMTQDVHDLTVAFSTIDWGSVSNISDDMSIFLNALGEMDWNDILALTAAMNSVTQSIQYMEITFASVDWAALSNVAYSWPVMTNALCGIDWNELHVIAQSAVVFSNRLTNVEAELDEIRAIVLENNLLLHSLTNSP